jgi:glycerol-1-phosphate dehydrogenase [NAD(P)+]
MRDDSIERLLKGEYPDPDGEGKLSVDCASVVFENTLQGSEADLLDRIGLPSPFALVCDPNTHEALGGRVHGTLRAAGKDASICLLPGDPHPDAETVELLSRDTSDAGSLIAVGSGTINDLCKYTAARDGKPYAVFASAPSMNGYTSANAAITEHGHKKSLPAKTARGAFFDLEVLARAPERLIRAGLGDSVCRPTAQADWLLSHLLFGRSYRRAPFDLLAPYEDELISRSGSLVEGGIEAVELLCRTLVMSGFGMTIAGSSNPASQGEHLISHYVDMVGPGDLPDSYHGEQIGVAALTVARLQEKILSRESLRVRPSRLKERDFTARYGEETGRSCWREFKAKRLDEEGAEALNRKLASDWGEIRRRIEAVTRPAEEIRAALERAGCPTHPEDLGWPPELYREAVLHCREIRNRYTFFDLAGDCGLLDELDFL